MKIEIENESNKELKFTLKNSSISFANLLRRYTINFVPTFAIEDVSFYENTTSFFDEYIAHRLGFIPLTTPLKAKSGEEVTLMLDIDEPGLVYSGNLKTSNKEVHPVSLKIPIIKLSEGQKLKIESKAVLGVARDHVKFQPGIISYSYEKEKPDVFKFFIESFGQMKAKDLLKVALGKIEEDATEIAKNLKKNVNE